MANEQNLKPFPKGVSGNPKGNALDRHSTKTISEWVNQLLNDESFEADILDGIEYKHYKGAPIKAILTAQIKLAMQHKDPAVKQKSADLLLKHGGTQKIQLGNDPDSPLTTGPDPMTAAAFADFLKQQKVE